MEKVKMNELSNDRVIGTAPRREPGCLIQALWLIFVGWWAGGIATSVAWFLNVTIIGLPIGLAILNNLPTILALQSPVQVVYTRYGSIGIQELRQYPFIVRAIYFLLIGWWWSGVWLSIAYALSVTIILLPFALSMVRRTPFMTTLKRY
jgi:uncharacterized membrane protein YccF (DUF307 family)